MNAMIGNSWKVHHVMLSMGPKKPMRHFRARCGANGRGVETTAKLDCMRCLKWATRKR